MSAETSSSTDTLAKAALTVDVQPFAGKRWSGAIPVEIRDAAKLVLSASGVSGHSIPVPAGRYFVTAQLPTGEQAAVEDIVELQPGESRRVTVSMPAAVVPAQMSDDLESAPAFKVRGPIRERPYASSIVQVNFLQSKDGRPPVVRKPTAGSRADIPYPPNHTWIEIAGKGGATYLAVPVDENRATLVQWDVDAKTGNIDLSFDFRDGALNSFFDFVDNDQAQGARAIGRSVIAQSEQFVMDKSRSPLLAVLGAYVLLRANELEGMDTWTDNLCKWFGWLPDTLAVRVEYLARQGDHIAASKALLDMPLKGIPWFRSGVGYVENRARLYASVGASKRSSYAVSDDELRQITAIAQRFGQLAAMLDMGHSTTVLRGMPRIE
jgi:hypothetical protein